MNYKENPFYILGASPEDSRRKIVALAEEKSLLGNADACTEARNILTNPQRRIAAEVGWFLDCSREDVEDILTYIQDDSSVGNQIQLPVLGLSPLSELNICLARLELILEGNFETLFPLLLRTVHEISRLYEAIIPEKVLEHINSCRSVASFPLVDCIKDVKEGITQLRFTIQRALSQKIQQVLPIFSSAIANTVAGDFAYNDRYKGHTVLEDFISEFELVSAEERNKCAAEVYSCIHNLQEAVTGNLDWDSDWAALYDALFNWKGYASSLHIVATFRGTRVQDSEDLFLALRNCAIDLFNKTDEKFLCRAILETMEEVFEDSPHHLDLIRRDMERIDALMEETRKCKEQKKKIQEILQRKTEPDGTEYYVTLPKNNFRIPKYCICCGQPTQSTVSVNDLNMPLCKTCEDKQRSIKGERYKKNYVYNQYAQSRATKFAWLCWSASVVIGVGIMLVLNRLVDITLGGSLVLSIIAASLALLYLIKRAITYPALGYEPLDDPNYPHFCSFRLLPSGGVEFRCINKTYAEIFAVENESRVSAYPVSPKTRIKGHDVRQPIAELYSNTGVLFRLLIGVLIAVALFVINNLPTRPTKPFHSTPSYSASSDSSVTEYADSSDAPALPPSNPSPEYIEVTEPLSGHVFYSKYTNKPCKFEVDNNSGSSYYMKFVNTNSGETVISFFVRGFSEVSIDMPTGTYELRYATGSTWYGESALFGDTTRYAKDEEFYPFESDSYSSTIWSVTFNAPSSSDMDTMYTETIDASEF